MSATENEPVINAVSATVDYLYDYASRAYPRVHAAARSNLETRSPRRAIAVAHLNAYSLPLNPAISFITTRPRPGPVVCRQYRRPICVKCSRYLRTPCKDYSSAWKVRHELHTARTDRLRTTGGGKKRTASSVHSLYFQLELSRLTARIAAERRRGEKERRPIRRVASFGSRRGHRRGRHSATLYQIIVRFCIPGISVIHSPWVIPLSAVFLTQTWPISQRVGDLPGKVTEISVLSRLVPSKREPFAIVARD